jgi:hypothetical protein
MTLNERFWSLSQGDLWDWSQRYALRLDRDELQGTARVYSNCDAPDQNKLLERFANLVNRWYDAPAREGLESE